MPKFYVQSGSLKMVLQAKDSESAAIWATHRALSQTLPFLCDDAEDYAALADLTQLGETIEVSQQGFAGRDRVTFKTVAIINEWNRLLVALDRLQERILRAAEDQGNEMTAV